MQFTIDIEATNRCNARCHFCPRELTPHQGLMSAEVFEQALARAVEFRSVASSRFDDLEVDVTLCGLGEPLLHGHVPRFVRMIGEAGFACALSSNASLLDAPTGQALLDAGLQAIYINAGDLHTDYEQVYDLPFERTRDNIARFVRMAAGRCNVIVVIVGHRTDPEHRESVERHWRELGVQRFQHHDLINRGGTLVVERMQFTTHPYLGAARELLRDRDAAPICGVPFRFLFVGYDGQYYLCSSDWEKRVPLGSVFDTSFSNVMHDKLEHVASREPICKSCCHDPLNRLAENLHTVAERGEAPLSARVALLEQVATADRQTRAVAAELICR